MKKQKMQIIILIALIFIGLTYAYYIYLFQPKWQSIQQEKDKLSKLETQYQQLAAYQNNKTGLQKDIESSKEKTDEQGQNIISHIDKPQLLVDLFSLAKNCNVTPISLGLGDVNKKDNTESITIDLKVSGDTDNILTLITALQTTSLENLAIQSINLVPKAQTVQNTTDNILNMLNMANKTTVPSRGNYQIADATPLPSKSNGAQAAAAEGQNSTNTGVKGSGSSSGTSGAGYSNGFNGYSAIQGYVLETDIKLTAYASSLGALNPTDRTPLFMTPSFGDTLNKLFQPAAETKS